MNMSFYSRIQSEIEVILRVQIRRHCLWTAWATNLELQRAMPAMQPNSGTHPCQAPDAAPLFSGPPTAARPKYFEDEFLTASS